MDGYYERLLFAFSSWIIWYQKWEQKNSCWRARCKISRTINVLAFCDLWWKKNVMAIGILRFSYLTDIFRIFRGSQPDPLKLIWWVRSKSCGWSTEHFSTLILYHAGTTKFIFPLSTIVRLRHRSFAMMLSRPRFCFRRFFSSVASFIMHATNSKPKNLVSLTSWFVNIQNRSKRKWNSQVALLL